MNVKNLFYFILLITFLISCQKEDQESTLDSQQGSEGWQESPREMEDNKENQVIEGIRATPVQPDTPSGGETSSVAPTYMNIELEGYLVPDINLNQFHGKVIFLNHWGSWCPPCRIEMPSIQALYDKYGDQVEFVMIASERRRGAHIPYLEKEGYTFPVYLPRSPISTEMKARAFPTTIILDKKGKVRSNDVGAADWNAPGVHQFLDQLLAE